MPVTVYFALNTGDTERLRYACETLMHLYFASQSNGGVQQFPAMHIAAEKQPIAELSLLMSYYYFHTWTPRRMRDHFPKIKTRIFIDSGGFSAMTMGDHVRLRDYVGWIQKHEKDIDVYANLDVIGDPKKTQRNQEVMEAEGLAPMPVFHVNSDLRYLDAMLERGYPYIAIGGMVPFMKGGSKRKLAAWLRQVFGRIGDRETKVHGFGVGTTWMIAKNFPWYSIDSSSWVRGFKYRLVAVFDDERGRFLPLDFGSRSRDCVAYAEVIRRYGFKPTDFYPRYDAMKAGALSIMSLLRAEAWLRENPRVMR